MIMLASFRRDSGAAIFTNQALMAALSQFVLILGGVAGPDLSCKATSDDEFKCAMDATVRDLTSSAFAK